LFQLRMESSYWINCNR